MCELYCEGKEFEARMRMHRTLFTLFHNTVYPLKLTLPACQTGEAAGRCLVPGWGLQGCKCGAVLGG